MPNHIKLEKGQAIPWPPSPTGFAQIDDLMRRRVADLDADQGLESPVVDHDLAVVDERPRCDDVDELGNGVQ